MDRSIQYTPPASLVPVSYTSGMTARERNKELLKEGKRWCHRCETTKPVSEFHKASGTKLAANCKPCAIDITRARYKSASPERLRRRRAAYRSAHPDARRQSDWKSRGIVCTVEQYNRLLQVQEGRCAICLQLPSGHSKIDQRPHLDHNHKTGVIRGLLCAKCNKGIGLLQDNPTVIDFAASYLRAYNGR